MEAQIVWQSINDYSANKEIEHKWNFNKLTATNLHLIYLEVANAKRKNNKKQLYRYLKKFAELAIGDLNKSVYAIDLTIQTLFLLSSSEKHTLNSLIHSILNVLVQDFKNNELYIAIILKLCTTDQKKEFCKLIAVKKGVHQIQSKQLIFHLLFNAAENSIKHKNLSGLFNKAKAKYLDDSACRLIILTLHYQNPVCYSFDKKVLNRISQFSDLDSRCHFYLGLVFFREKNFEKSCYHLSISLNTGSHDDRQLYRLFLRFTKLNRIDLAQRCVRQISSSPNCCIGVIKGLVKKADTINLNPYLEMILEANMKSEYHQTEAKLFIISSLIKEYLRLNKSEDAIQIFTEHYGQFPFDPALRMRIIEKLIENNRSDEVEVQFKLLNKQSSYFNSHFYVLKVRDAISKGNYKEAETIFKNAPESCFNDEYFLIEIGLHYLHKRSWRLLQELLSQGKYREPALKALQIIAKEKAKDYEFVLRYFNVSIVHQISELQYDWTHALNKECLYSCFLAFSINGRWTHIQEIVKVSDFSLQNENVLAFFDSLAEVYLTIENENWYPNLKNKILSLLSSLLASSERPEQLRLLVRLFQDSSIGHRQQIMNDHDFIDMSSYLLFLVSQTLERHLDESIYSNEQERTNFEEELSAISLQTAEALMERLQII